LIFLNAARAGCRQFYSMSQSSIIGQRLLAHARICREVAAATTNEETAGELERMALDCVEAARGADSEPQCQMFHGVAAIRRPTA
jgi:hypothetical protein